MKSLLFLYSLSYFSLVICAVENKNIHNRETLVLLDNLSTMETHSQFFSFLQDRGYHLTIKLADDSYLTLTRYGELLYKLVIIFSPYILEFGGSISTETIARFVDEGGNLLVAANAASSDVYRDIGAECGIELAEEPVSVIDHFKYDETDEGEHTKIVVPLENLLDAPVIVGTNNTAPFLYEGTGLILDTHNELVLPILAADSTAFTYNPKNQVRQYPHAVGKKTVLIAGLQARNNARIIFSGSLYFFSNHAFNSPVAMAHGSRLRSGRSGNKQLALRLTEWVLGERGRLRVKSVAHNLNYGTLILQRDIPCPYTYTITDEVVYRIEIQEYKKRKWRPFLAGDIQLEFVRIDPFIRITLSLQYGGVYQGAFMIPDVWGVYKFRVHYDRVGYTRLYNSTQVSVRPLQHTQYERFIPSAFPYYVSAFSMMIGVYLFSILFLYHTDKYKSK